MTNTSSPMQHTAELIIQANPPELRASVKVTTMGLVAITGLVSGILLSTSLLVWVAGAVHRKTHFPRL